MKSSRLLGAVCAAVIFYSSATMAVSFTPLGFEGSAFAVSDDGSVVVGYIYNQSASGHEAFRWTSGGGMAGLGDLDGGVFSSIATGVSGDGSVVVGYSESASGREAFRWTSSGGMVGLGDLDGGSFDSVARGVSDDGSVVIGSGHTASGVEAFRWTSSGGMIGLGDLGGVALISEGFGVSGDGSVVGGGSYSDSGYEAVRWTSSGGMVGLGDLAGGIYRSSTTGVSGDGSVVVGWSESASGFEAFRWTSSGGMVGLGDLAGGIFWSQAEGVSGDGSVVVGRSRGSSPLGGAEAFFWTSSGGMKSVASILTANGIDLTGWTLQSATGVSADGNTIVGTGINPDGHNESWIANVNGGLLVSIEIPEGTRQECATTGGSNVTMLADISIFDPNEVVSIFWYLDGDSTAVASGDTVEFFVSLGTYSVEARVNTITLGESFGTEVITIEDTIGPQVDPAFLDSKTGEVITSVSRKGSVGIAENVVDTCDPAPTITSTVGLPTQEGDALSIKGNKKDASITVSSAPNTDTATLAVIAEDASGNMSGGSAALTVTP